MIIDNTDKVLREVRRKSSAGLREIAPVIVKEARRVVVKKSGRLERSITAKISDKKVVVGSPLNYAPKIETNKPYLRPALLAVKEQLRKVFRA